MPPKRESSITIKLSDFELAQLGLKSRELDMTSSEFVRACLAIGAPILESVPFTQRVRLEDNQLFKERQ